MIERCCSEHGCRRKHHLDQRECVLHGIRRCTICSTTPAPDVAPFTPAQTAAARDTCRKRGLPASAADVVLDVVGPDVAALRREMAAAGVLLGRYREQFGSIEVEA